MSAQVHKVRIPLMPTYRETRAVMKVVAGTPRSDLMKLIKDVHDQMGTPQNPVDWTDPDSWIDERLDGTSAALARRIWQETGKSVNPRHIRGSYFLFNHYELLKADGEDVLRLTDRGRRFLNNDDRTVQEIDDLEGIGEILRLLALKPGARRADLLPEWSEFLREYSRFGSPSTFKDTLRRRLVNITDRGFVGKEGITYTLTDEGRKHVAAFAGATARDPQRELIRSIEAYNNAQREALRERLIEMKPAVFEHLARDLLEAMGYEDVEVTRQSGDFGVDVVATVQVGITTVREVVQVKRRRGTIGRPVLDQLRGALPYHDAIRGTIVTIGTFSRGCKDAAIYPGAAPITLIDGDRLLGLLMEHEIGIQQRKAIIYEIEEGYYDDDEAEEVTG